MSYTQIQPCASAESTHVRSWKKRPNKLLFALSDETDPYTNLAFERVLLEGAGKGELILYLWQSEDTVVIGRNQNPWAECDVDRFQASGGRIARRFSGGGAVYQDLGNLNFSFIARKPVYDISFQMRIICEALHSFGLDAHLSGRNDLEIAGRKCSGNAFFSAKDAHCHHGTLMVSVDEVRLEDILHPDQKKLSSKGIASAAARIRNISDLAPQITIDSLKVALMHSASDLCGCPSSPRECTMNDPSFETIRQNLASWDWIFSNTAVFTHCLSERFSWGCIEINLVVQQGLIQTARLYSDALDADFIAQLQRVLEGVRYTAADIKNSLNKLHTENEEQQTMCDDCKKLICT